MGRIKISLPEKFQFKTELQVRITDINYGGHLGNDSMLSLLHEGRMRFLNHLGYSEANVEGVGIMMTDCHINYISEGLYGDELVLSISVVSMDRTGCDFIYKVINKKTSNEIARASTSVVFYDYQTKKLKSTPQNFIQKISKLHEVF